MCQAFCIAKKFPNIKKWNAKKRKKNKRMQIKPTLNDEKTLNVN